MWRRIISSQLQSLASSSAGTACRSASRIPAGAVNRSIVGSSRAPATFLFSRHFSTGSEHEVSKPKPKVEDVVPIATGHEREELEAMLEGRDILEIDHPVGPFGTKEEPAVVKSYYDKRIVGCPGGEGEDEHDVVWFWLKKGEPHECPVCTQYFMLEVVGPGGPPDGHATDEEEDEHHCSKTLQQCVVPE